MEAGCHPEEKQEGEEEERLRKTRKEGVEWQ
jgi:hypothetical protein